MQGVLKLLKNLNPNKASGPDEVTPRTLKELHEELAPAITLLFRRSMYNVYRTATIRLETCIRMPNLQERTKIQPCELQPSVTDLYPL